MAVEERDPHTGYTTTGHEWNGITELNRPVPKAIWAFLALTIAFSVVYWILMPAWPLGQTYTKGLLGVDQRLSVAKSLQSASAKRSSWTRKIETQDFAEIRADASLMRRVRETGRALFEDNCAVCHGMRAEGQFRFPSLTDGAWLWGGDPETVSNTIRVGINSTHPDTRVSQMPAFGRDGILKPDAIRDVAAYVRSLSRTVSVDANRLAAGAKTFETQCAVCHGKNAKGDPKTGSPDLTDGHWIYGGDLDAIYTSIYRGRQGHMPHWEGRLSAIERKILTLFILDLGATDR